MEIKLAMAEPLLLLVVVGGRGEDCRRWKR